MANSIDLLERVRGLGSTKKLKDIETELGKHDREARKNKEKENYRVELWDKVSPINNVPAERILEDGQCFGEVYLVYINNKLTILQKHAPDEAGFKGMTAEEAHGHANRIIDDMVSAKVDKDIEDEVVRAILLSEE